MYLINSIIFELPQIKFINYICLTTNKQNITSIDICTAQTIEISTKTNYNKFFILNNNNKFF